MEATALVVLHTELRLYQQILIANPFSRSCLKSRNETEFNIMLAVLENIMLIRRTKPLSVRLQLFQQSRLFSSALSQWLWMWTGGCELTDVMKKPIGCNVWRRYRGSV